MIHTWWTDVAKLEEEKEMYLQELSKAGHLGQSRVAKVERCQDKQGKLQRLGAGLLLVRMKEAFQLPDEFLYNLSHSGDYALCSVEDGQDFPGATMLGCDLEMVGKDHPDVARRFFTAEEYEWIYGGQQENTTDRFYRMWVLKESFLKATRKGLTLSMKKFALDLSQGKPILIRQPEEFLEPFYYREYTLENVPVKAAVCANQNVFSENVTQIFL